MVLRFLGNITKQSNFIESLIMFQRQESRVDEEIQLEAGSTTLAEVRAVLGRTAPPSYHNSPIASNKGPPPSYEEVIDPNGNLNSCPVIKFNSNFFLGYA